MKIVILSDEGHVAAEASLKSANQFYTLKRGPVEGYVEFYGALKVAPGVITYGSEPDLNFGFPLRQAGLSAYQHAIPLDTSGISQEVLQHLQRPVVNRPTEPKDGAA